MTIQHNFPEVKAQLDAIFAAWAKEKMAAVRKVVLQSYSDILRVSPVATGRFRGSHSLSVSEAHPNNAPAGLTNGEYSQAARDNLASATSTLAGVSRIPGQMSFFIVNNLPYAASLEEGSSQQAPAGVYSVAAQRAERLIHRMAASRKVSE